ncbi:MAG: hypothetical protein Q8K37_05100 [Alphaproteobacteria bacterium]|nr:hypothetical protein [Alphaproteobacteria bacterium]
MNRLKKIVMFSVLLFSSAVQADYTNFCINMTMSNEDAKNISKVVPTKGAAEASFPAPDQRDKNSFFYFVERMNLKEYHVTLDLLKGKEKNDVFNDDDLNNIKGFSEAFKKNAMHLSNEGYVGNAVNLLLFVHYKGLDGQKACKVLTEDNLDQMYELQEIYYANLVLRTDHDTNLSEDWNNHENLMKEDVAFEKYALRKYPFVPHITIANIFKYANRAYEVVKGDFSSVVKNKKHSHVRAKSTAFTPAEFEYLKTFFNNVNAHFKRNVKPSIKLTNLKVTTKPKNGKVRILRNIDLLN